jgi:hypothetical protein
MYRDDFLLRAPSGGRRSFEIFSNSVFRSSNLGFVARCANFENHTAGSGFAGDDCNRCDDRGLEQRGVVGAELVSGFAGVVFGGDDVETNCREQCRVVFANAARNLAGPLR